MEKIFWDKLDLMIEGLDIIIDYPKGSIHAFYQEGPLKYDLGYIEVKKYENQKNITLWLGSDSDLIVNAIMVLIHHDSFSTESVFLMACKEEEIEEILKIQNRTKVKAIILKRTVY